MDRQKVKAVCKDAVRLILLAVSIFVGIVVLTGIDSLMDSLGLKGVAGAFFLFGGVVLVTVWVFRVFDR